jgi:tetratricopeptide (TPR) repeat protein
MKVFFTKYKYEITASLLLILITIAIYYRVANFEYITFDDDLYVYDNTHIKDGLTFQNMLWSLTTSHAYNWHPLTWISLYVDSQFFGSTPGVHHLVNVFFHISNSLLLLLILVCMTKKFWSSIIVAGLFALHPLHVESVAWISERKDVLSTLFWMLTMISYYRYVSYPKIGRYILVLLFFILGLLAKQMLVTLPFVLLLMDFWPLRRLQFPESSKGDTLRIIAEKVPLFIFAMIFSFIIFLVQKNSAVYQLTTFPLDVRMANAIVSYLAYIKDMLWPFNLAIFYPHPRKIPLITTVLSGILLLSVTLIFLKYIQKFPFLAIGWFWYMGTLVPVIGIIQVGLQEKADRYTYIPLIGIFIIIAWGLSELLTKFPNKKLIMSMVVSIILIMCVGASWVQVGYWKNSETLYTHAIRVTKDNYGAQCGLAGVLMDKGQTDEAIDHYRETIRIKPDYMLPRFNLGIILLNKGKYDEAIEQFQEIANHNPSPTPETHLYLGIALAAENKIDEAINHYYEALKMNPALTAGQFNLGYALLRKGKLDQAIMLIQNGLRTKPYEFNARIELGITFIKLNRVEEAIKQFSIATQINPRSEQAKAFLGNALLTKNNIKSLIRNLESQVDNAHLNTDKLYKLTILYSSIGQYDKSISCLQKVLSTQPENPDMYYNLACLYAREERLHDAVRCLQQAVEKGFKNFDLIKNDTDLINIRNTSYVIELMKNH